MKKFMSIFLALILISAIPVFAGNGNSGNAGTGNSESTINSNSNTAGNFADKGAQGSGEIMRNQVKTATKTQEKAMTKTMNQERKDEFNSLKERAKECKSNNDETCIQVRNQLRSKAKENLIWSAGKSEDILGKAKAKISSLKITEEEKTALADKITEKINILAEERKNLEEDISEISTNTIKNSVAVMRNAWNEIKKETNMNMHRHALNKFNELFEKMSKTPEVLNKQLQKLNEAGSEIDDSLTQAFFEKKAEAVKAYEEAKEYLDNAEQNTEDEASELMKLSRDKMKETQKLLVQAREELRKAVQEMKSFKKGQTTDEEGDNK